MLEKFNRLDKAEVIKDWYDGYVFGSTKIYCPWDVVNYVSTLLQRENAKSYMLWGFFFQEERIGSENGMERYGGKS